MAFATTADVAVRLGRDLSASEQAMAEMVIDAVTGLIVDAVGRDADWAAALDPVPAALKMLCVEKVIAVGTNPNGLAAESEQLGAHSYSKTFRRGDGGVFLTETEECLVRSAVYGATSGSARTRSILDDECSEASL